jgi:nitrogen fixation NifU-like protein
MPTRQESIDFILDHYDHPRHQGRLEHADLVLEGGNPGCGDVVKIYLKLDEADRVVNIAFEGEGCTISQAGVSVTTDMVLGKTLAEITALNQDEVIDALGREVVATRLRCATLGLNTLKSAEQQRRQNLKEKRKS